MNKLIKNSLKLYYTPRACSLVSYVALKEVDAKFEIQPINLRNKEQMTDEFLRINPKHRVPVLFINGEALTENVAILLWIDSNFPDANLISKNKMQRAQTVSFLAWCSSSIHPALTPNGIPERYCDLPNSAENVKKCAQKLLNEYFLIAEGMLNEKKWFFDYFSAADIYFLWCFRRALQFEIDLNFLPNCNAHFQRVLTRPSVQDAIEFESKTIESFNWTKILGDR